MCAEDKTRNKENIRKYLAVNYVVCVGLRKWANLVFGRLFVGVFFGVNDYEYFLLVCEHACVRVRYVRPN